MPAGYQVASTATKFSEQGGASEVAQDLAAPVERASPVQGATSGARKGRTSEVTHPSAVRADPDGGRRQHGFGTHVARERTLRSNSGNQVGRHRVGRSISSSAPE